MSTRIFGSAIRRREDPRLITGSALYTDDITLPGMVYAAMLRSPHAHAKITSIDTSKAASATGVLAVYTGVDIEGQLQPVPCAWLLPDSDLKVAGYQCIAKDVVRYTGDIVAVVVADTQYQAYDAIDLIAVTYDGDVTAAVARTHQQHPSCLQSGTHEYQTGQLGFAVEVPERQN